MKTKVVFLDRDGVICEKRHHESGDERNYITKWKDFVWIPGSKEAIVKLLENDYSVIVVSNQAWVGGNKKKAHLARAFMRRMWTEVRKELSRDDWARFHGMSDRFICLICPHAKDAGCSCRKPRPGMVYSAAYQHDLRLKDAWIVGDTMDDLKAGWLAGLRKLIMVNCDFDPVYLDSGHKNWKRNRLEGKAMPDLARAVDFILEWDGKGD